MGREIKFRGYEDGHWVYGGYVKTAFGMHYIIPQNIVADVIPKWVVNPKSVGQYTGLKDKNGEEIYEGDILTDHGDEGPLYIEYSKEYAAFVFVDKFDSFGTTLYTASNISYEGFEVIGNLYENPELLEVKS